MVAFRRFVVAVSACLFVAMNAGISIALDPVKSILEVVAVDSNAVLVATRLVVSAVAVDAPVATNTAHVAPPIALEDLVAFILSKNGSFTVTPEEQVNNGTDLFAPVSSPVALEDLVAFILSKNGQFPVTPEEQVSNITDLFASSLLLIASASRRLRDAMEDAKPSTSDSVNNVLSWFADMMQASHAAFRSAVTALTPKSSAPTAFLLPEILNILCKQCPLSVTTCEVDAMDTKPSSHDFVNDVLSWFANTVQVSRAAFRYVITALTPTSLAPARLRSPEIIMILSKKCPLIVTTCEVDAMDDTKPSTYDSINNVLAWFADMMQASHAAFRSAVTALTPQSSAPTAFLLPEILNILCKQCPLIVSTCEVDAMDNTKPLIVLKALRIASRYCIPAVTLGSIVSFASGVKMVASTIYLLAIMFALGFLYVINGVDDDVWEDAHDALEDAHDALEDADDGVAGQDDVPVEAPVAAPTIAAPLRRSKRVAAQQCDALRSAVTTRRSARLAGKPRVNYKY
jgi:hypothetical protein